MQAYLVTNKDGGPLQLLHHSVVDFLAAKSIEWVSAQSETL
jgi:hypothetical protein